ncbi:MAG: DUF1697 domain-containing protein [Acidobacteriia bacterium]|nr:DUF1697 domain-containing protein [Terriglobia bacterium]
MKQSKTLSTYVALLRGINVGGKNRLPMPDLAQMFVEAGCADVRTYIQSGNVIFKASEAHAGKLPVLIPRRISEDYGYKIPVVTRTAGQLQDTIQNNPFLKAGTPEATLHVYFLASLPDPSSIAALDPDRSPPDRFCVRERDVYVQLPNGMARTKLTNAYFDSKLATISTARNWRTVLTLFELMQG